MNVSQIINQNIQDINSKDITIILSVHSRPDYFEELINNIDKIIYNSIWISCWHSPYINKFYNLYLKLKKNVKNKIYFFNSNYQLKYFGRFQLAYQVKTKYTLILDDDCIIQPNFYKLCIKMINIPKYNGLLGIKGWIFPKENEYNRLGTYGQGDFYHPYPTINKEYKTNTAFEIDIVGGVWFFRTEWILYLFREFPYTFETGEDFHFSNMLKKYGNIKTYFIPNDRHYRDYMGCSDNFNKIDLSNNSRNNNMGELRKKIFWKQYLNLTPFIKRIKIKIKNLLIICNEDDYYLYRLIKNKNNMLILILSIKDLNIHENNHYLNNLDKYDNFNLIKNFTNKYPSKINCLILNGFLQKSQNNISTYTANIGKLFNYLYDFDYIYCFNYYNIIDYFNINNKKICVFDNKSYQKLSIHSNINLKFFKGDIVYFNFLIKNNIPFSLIRFGDGKYNILMDILMDTNQDGVKIDNIIMNKKLYKKFKQLFTNMRDNLNFYIGIPCSCCMKDKKIIKLKKNIGINFNNYTWGNIFVNNNYNYFINDIYNNTLKKKEIILICNKKSIVKNLDLNVIKVFKLNYMWYDCDYLINELIDYAMTIKNKVFLFAAGPLSNIAIYELYHKNPDNFYIDIGSVFNVILNLDNRGYLKGSYTKNKVCRWNKLNI